MDKVQFRVRFDDLINDASNDSINQLLIRVLSTSSSSLHPVDPDDQDDRSTRSCRSARKRDDEKEDRDDFKRSLRKVLVQRNPSVLWPIGYGTRGDSIISEFQMFSAASGRRLSDIDRVLFGVAISRVRKLGCPCKTKHISITWLFRFEFIFAVPRLTIF